MKIRKQLLSLLLAALTLWGIRITAYAQEVPDLSRKGSIQITMCYDGNPVSGGTLTLYRVGDVSENDGNYGFMPTGDFKGYVATFDKDNIQSPELAKKLAEYAANKKLSAVSTKTIGKDGTVIFSDLKLGLYLLVQEKAAEGYNKAVPFLVSVPMTEEGKYVYDADANPKVELEKAPQPDTPSKPSDSKLPQTGQLNWPVPVLVVLGLMLFSTGWVLRFGKQRDGHAS